MTWELEEIRSRVRVLTGRSTESRLSTAELDGYINNYYQNHLPDLLTPESLQALFTCNTEVGRGEYGVPTNLRALYPPVFVDREKVLFTHNVGWFFEKYKDRSEQSPGLPETVLYFDRTLWMAPIPNDIYTVQVHALYRPDALVNADDQPIDPRWGEAIAVGAASLIFNDNGDFEEALRMDSFLEYQLRLIRQTNILNWQGMRPAPQF